MKKSMDEIRSDILASKEENHALKNKIAEMVPKPELLSARAEVKATKEVVETLQSEVEQLREEKATRDPALLAVTAEVERLKALVEIMAPKV